MSTILQLLYRFYFLKLISIIHLLFLLLLLSIIFIIIIIIYYFYYFLVLITIIIFNVWVACATGIYAPRTPTMYTFVLLIYCNNVWTTRDTRVLSDNKKLLYSTLTMLFLFCPIILPHFLNLILQFHWHIIRWFWTRVNLIQTFIYTYQGNGKPANPVSALKVVMDIQSVSIVSFYWNIIFYMGLFFFFFILKRCMGTHSLISQNKKSVSNFLHIFTFKNHISYLIHFYFHSKKLHIF